MVIFLQKLENSFKHYLRHRKQTWIVSVNPTSFKEQLQWRRDGCKFFNRDSDPYPDRKSLPLDPTSGRGSLPRIVLEYIVDSPDDPDFLPTWSPWVDTRGDLLGTVPGSLYRSDSTWVLDSCQVRRSGAVCVSYGSPGSVTFYLPR